MKLSLFACLSILLLTAMSAWAEGDSNTQHNGSVLCPTETDKKPELVFKIGKTAKIFACGKVDEHRKPPTGKTWMTELYVYTPKEDGSPTALFENDSELRNFFVSVEDFGIKANEMFIFDQVPIAVFSTEFRCDKTPCYSKTRCVRSKSPAQGITISRKKLTNKEAVEAAEEHLRQLFKLALSGNQASRQLFKDKKLKSKLDGNVHDLFDNFQQILAQYEKLGC